MTSIVINQNSNMRVFRDEAKSKKDVHDDLLKFQHNFDAAPTNEAVTSFFEALGYSQEHALGITIN